MGGPQRRWRYGGVLPMTLLPLLAVAVGAAGLFAGLLALAAANARTPNGLVNVLSGLLTAFVLAGVVDTLLAWLFRFRRPWLWGGGLGLATAALPVGLIGIVNLNEALRPVARDTGPALPALLEAESHILDTVDPRSGFADLEPLRAAWADQRIVALGEATHGTSEFFRMKHRLVEFLVVEMGFRHFAMETHPTRHGPALNDYIQGGDTSPLTVLYWPWATVEYLDMLRWMRVYNASREPSERIVFHGIDPQVGERDRDMAANVAALLESEPEAKVIVWAANSHVRGALDAMGQHLKASFGSEVYLLGLEFHRGAFTSRMKAVQTYEVGPFPPSYYTHALVELPGSIRFLDFAEMARHPQLRAWLAEERISNHLFENYALTRWVRPIRRVRQPWLDLFDGIVFIEESSPATTIPRGRPAELASGG